MSHQHDWPAELDLLAACEKCGLPYVDYSEQEPYNQDGER